MDTRQNLDSVILGLQKLYSKVAQLVFQYRKQFTQYWPMRRHEGDIRSPLNDYIELIARQARVGSEAGQDSMPGLAATISTTNEADHVDSVDSGDTDRIVVPSLAKHFESRSAATVFIPGVGEKLKNSVWNHLHEAIRLGRQGDTKNARLHADLANGALKEAVKYMSQEQFSALIAEVEQKLREVLTEVSKTK
jgi:hypothetical protein